MITRVIDRDFANMRLDRFLRKAFPNEPVPPVTNIVFPFNIVLSLLLIFAVSPTAVIYFILGSSLHLPS